MTSRLLDASRAQGVSRHNAIGHEMTVRKPLRFDSMRASLRTLSPHT